MKRYIILLVFIFAFISNIFSQKLTEYSKVYILTCSPGDELYQAFGHTAIWITDDTAKINYIYHYGTFNFSDPNFYINFVRGRLNYMLGIESFKSFIQEYTDDGRDVYKFELNMTFEQKQNLYKYLSWKALPENKYYKYDFFVDNCATRVRDVIQNIYGDSLVFAQPDIKLTYRQAITPYLQAKPWTRFGINLLLGIPADKKLDSYSAMFLPDYIDTIITASVLSTPDGQQNLGLSRTQLIKCDYKIGPMPFFNPSYFFWTLLVIILIISFIEFKFKKNFKIIDFIFLFIFGLAGIIMLFMWFGTDHVPTKWNLNVIWAFPFHIVIAFILNSKKSAFFIKKYFLIFSIINILLIISSWTFLPQQFDVAVLPIILMITVRFLLYLT